MKFAIFFCVVTIACVAQAQRISPPSNVDDSETIKIEEAQQKPNYGLTNPPSGLLQKTVDKAKENAHNLNAQLKKGAGMVKESVTGSVDKVAQEQRISPPSNVDDSETIKIEEAQQKPNYELTKPATDLLHKTVDKAKENAHNLNVQLKKGAEKVKGSVTGSVDKVVQDANEEIAEAEIQAKEQGVENTAECTRIARRISVTAKYVTVDIVKCVTDKAETGTVLMSKITKKCTTAAIELLDLSKQIDLCKQKTGVSAKVSALSCQTASGAKASWLVGTQIPSLAFDLKELKNLISTMHGCMKLNIDAFKGEVKAIKETIRECLGQQIKRIKSG